MISHQSTIQSLAETSATWFGGAVRPERKLRTVLLDTLWIIFFVGASGITIPSVIGRIQPFVWFPADLIAVYFLLRNHNYVLSFVRQNAILMAWPLLACLSAVWSYTPIASFWFGLQLLFTMIVGIIIGKYASLTKILKIVFVASFICSVLSLLSIFLMPGYASFGGSWKGLYTHKNLLGAAMAFQAIGGICLFLHGWHRAFTALGIAIAFGLLMLSGSGSAVLATCVGIAPLPLLFAFRNGGTAFHFTLGATIVAGAAILIILEVNTLDPIELILGELGKERTLTGRTEIWDFASDAFNTHPWLGFGYRAYWVSEDTTARTLQFVMKQGIGFSSFHNCYLETVVAFGFIGPIALVSGLLFVMAVSLRRFARHPSFINCWPLLYLAYLVTICFSESFLFVNHGLNDLLLMAIVAANSRKLVRDVPASHFQPRNDATPEEYPF